VFPVGIGLRNPRSQKRDLGHPSISPSILQRAHALSFLSRLASASRLLGMTKERVVVKLKVVSGPDAFSTASGPATTFHAIATLSFVFPSEAEGSAALRTPLGNVLTSCVVERFAVSFPILTRTLWPPKSSPLNV
jgi:hypothetical protein